MSDHARSIQMEIPFGLHTWDLVLDPATDRDVLAAAELKRISQEMTADEMVRVLKSAIMLHHVGAGSLGPCLQTAAIWERG